MTKKLLIFVLLLMVVPGFLMGCNGLNNGEEDPTVEIDLYFGDEDAIETGTVGEYGYVTPVSREIREPETPEMMVRAALEELIQGPLPEEEEEYGVLPVVHDSLEIRDVIIEDDIATINVSGNMFEGDWQGGTVGGSVFIGSFVLTASQFEEVERVLVEVENEVWDDGHFYWDEPISSFAEHEEVLVPEEIETWIEYSRELQMGQAREYDGVLYLLATYGQRPTGGYEVEVTDIREEEDQLVVTVNFKEPGEDEVVTDAITYPYDVKTTEPTSIPVIFEAEGDLAQLPVLQDLDWLPEMTAGDENIRLFSPGPKDIVPREFDLEGIELVFEGTVNYRISDREGRELKSGFTTGHGYNWGSIDVTLEVPEAISAGEKFIVEVFSISARDGSEENHIELELVLE